MTHSRASNLVSCSKIGELLEEAPNRPTSGYGYVIDTVGKFEVGGVRIFWRGVHEKGEPPEPPPPGYGPALNPAP